nr:MAG TPA: hypothetical protein [Caudoviricetes sp.]
MHHPERHLQEDPAILWYTSSKYYPSFSEFAFYSH